jgi:Asp/Glu/hydantoin racemase
MRLLILNPNMSEAMTRQLVDATAVGGVAPRGLTAGWGVEIIASHSAFAVGAHAAMDAWVAYPDKNEIDAVLVGCFGDPGVDALAELTPLPVFGLAEAAIRDVLTVAGRFAIVTAGRAWSAMLDQLVYGRGLGTRYAGTFAANLSGLSMMAHPEACAVAVNTQIAAAEAAGATHIILGGAVFVGRTGIFQSRAVLVDCLDAAIAWIGRAVEHGKSQREGPDVAERPMAPPVQTKGLSEGLAGRLENRETV